MVSEGPSPSRADGASLRPPKKKPMHDAMAARKQGEPRSSANYHHEASASTDAHHAEKKMLRAYHDDCTFRGNQLVSDALLSSLAAHGASAPWFVDSKELTDTDARPDQNRLQFSSSSPIARVLTAAEMARASIGSGSGLLVMAFDRRGEMYSFKCRYFQRKCYCRLMHEWGKFLRDHHLAVGKTDKLARRIVVEVWAFRSRALPNYKEEKDRFDCGHPDGALGLVVLHRVEDEAAVLEAPDEETDAEEEKEEEEVEQAVTSTSVQEDAPANAAQVHGEVPSIACAKNGGAGAHATSYENKLLQVVGAILLVLRTSDRTRCKHDDGDKDVAEGADA